MDWANLENLDITKLARALERDCQEGVQWEIRRLEWILAHEPEQPQAVDKAA